MCCHLYQKSRNEYEGRTDSNNTTEPNEAVPRLVVVVGVKVVVVSIGVDGGGGSNDDDDDDSGGGGGAQHFTRHQRDPHDRLGGCQSHLLRHSYTSSFYLYYLFILHSFFHPILSLSHLTITPEHTHIHTLAPPCVCVCVCVCVCIDDGDKEEEMNVHYFSRCDVGVMRNGSEREETEEEYHNDQI